ncbi:MAG: DegQ family serine endoprotease [Thiotrichales bacterium]
MTLKKPFFSSLALTVLLLFTSTVHAALPAAVNGEPVPTLAPMLERVTPAVVHIATQGRVVTRGQQYADPLFEYFFGSPRQERKTQGLGSGVIFNADKGLIITNNHVIEDSDNITVTVKDGRSFQAQVMGADPDADIAVLKIDADNLTEIPLADSDMLRVGDFVVAIGNPFGLKQTVTSGIVSGLGRTGLGIESYENFIQTDASINPGNSGGALVNLRGELVGINTAILGPNGGNIGIGFAIPINMVNIISNQLIQFGEVRRGRLGVGIQDLTPDLARAFKIKQRRGAVIAQVESESPAERAGLEVGDVVIAVNGKSISGSDQLRTSIGLLSIGSKVTLKVLRNGKTKTIVAHVEEPPVSALVGGNLSEKLGGATFEEAVIDGESVVTVAEIKPGTPAARAGLMPGDVILSVNRQPVATVNDIATSAKTNGKAMLLNISREGRGFFVLIQ